MFSLPWGRELQIQEGESWGSVAQEVVASGPFLLLFYLEHTPALSHVDN